MKILGYLIQARVCLLALIIGCLPVAQPDTARAADAKEAYVYIGTYTGPKSKGIYLYRMNLASGVLKPVGVAAETISPSFLVLHPNHEYLYAINEVDNFNGAPGGGVSAFSIDAKSGQLKLLNQQTSGGTGPCHIEIDQTGKMVIAANYGGGSFESLPVLKDGSLGKPATFIQDFDSEATAKSKRTPHGHCATIDAANRIALVCDLGLDRIYSYKLDLAKGALIPNDIPWVTVKPGSGPRHLTFDPKGHFAYVINELGNTIIAFSYDAAKGTLHELQTVSTLPDGFKGNSSTAEIQVHPSGKFLYGSNRGHDSIAVYAIDEKNGTLTFVEHQSTQGKAPRHFTIDPTGRWLLAANMNTDNIVTYSIDQQTGRLTPTGQNIHNGTPVCITFLPIH